MSHGLQGTQAKITLSLECNNDCVFCYNRLRKDTGSQTIPFERVLELIDEAVVSGADSLNFIGGEVTILPRFAEQIAYAGGRFTDISINTNGRRLSDEGFARAVVKAGLTQVDVSLHAARASTHDALSRAPGAWAETCEGLRHLRTLQGEGARLSSSVTTLLLAETLPELDALGDLLRELGVRSWRLKYAHGAFGCGSENDPNAYILRYSEVIPALRRALDRHDQALNISVHDIPLCLLGDLLLASTDDDDHEVAQYLEAGVEEARPVMGHWGETSARCDACVAREACCKISPAYLRRWGDKELQAFDESGYAAAVAQAERRRARSVSGSSESPSKDAGDAALARWRQTIDQSAEAGDWTRVRRLARARLRQDPDDGNAQRSQRMAEMHLLNVEAEAAAEAGDPARARLLHALIRRRYGEFSSD